jgi:hypothetical protein
MGLKKGRAWALVGGAIVFLGSGTAAFAQSAGDGVRRTSSMDLPPFAPAPAPSQVEYQPLPPTGYPVGATVLKPANTGTSITAAPGAFGQSSPDAPAQPQFIDGPIRVISQPAPSLAAPVESSQSVGTTMSVPRTPAARAPIGQAVPDEPSQRPFIADPVRLIPQPAPGSAVTPVETSCAVGTNTIRPVSMVVNVPTARGPFGQSVADEPTQAQFIDGPARVVAQTPALVPAPVDAPPPAMLPAPAPVPVEVGQPVQVRNAAPMAAPATCAPEQDAGWWERWKTRWADCKQRLQYCFLGFPEEFEAQPLGASVYAFGTIMVANGDAARMVLYQYDFIDGSDQLSQRGRDQLAKIVCLLDRNPAPLVIERTLNATLDEARRLAVLNDLGRSSVLIVPERVVVGRPTDPGLPGLEAELIHQNQLITVQSGGVRGGAGGGSIGGTVGQGFGATGRSGP